MSERIVAFAVLALPVWPAVVHALSSGLRLMEPRLARVSGLLVLLYTSGILFATVALPVLSLLVLVVLVAVLMLLFAWYGRVDRGSGRGWPPGSLRPMDLRFWFDRSFFLERFCCFGSPFKASQFLRPTACIVGLPQGLALLREHQRDLQCPALAFSRFVRGGFLRFMPPERHLRTRDLLHQLISRDVYEGRAPLVRRLFAEGVEALQTNGDSSAPVAPRVIFQRMLFPLWMALFFGIEPGSSGIDRLTALYQIIDIRNPRGASDREVREALEDIVAILGEQSEKLVLGSGEEHPSSCFLGVLAQRYPQALGDRTLLDNLIYLAHTSWGDVSGLLCWLLRKLVDHPAWADRLRDGLGDQTVPAAGGLADRIVSETLRFEQIETIYRVASRDIRSSGFLIPAGWLVRICLRESHSDPLVFPQPELFNPDRFLDHSYARNQFAPFGLGLEHACLGEGLTRMVAAIFAEEVVRGRRWSTVVEAPPEYGPWRHWRPGSGWRVAACSS